MISGSGPISPRRKRMPLALAPPPDRCSLDDEPTLSGAVSLALPIAGALTLAVCLIAVAVGLVFAAPARHWLGFPFTGIPSRPGEAAAIFLHNLRALAGVGGLLLFAQAPYWTPRGAQQPGAVQRTGRFVGEALVGGTVTVNVIVVGLSLGAYGVRMLRAALPQGPFELAAYSLALALYLQGRRRRLPTRHILVIAAVCVATLAVAAVLETFVTV